MLVFSVYLLSSLKQQHQPPWCIWPIPMPIPFPHPTCLHLQTNMLIESDLPFIIIQMGKQKWSKTPLTPFILSFFQMHRLPSTPVIVATALIIRVLLQLRKCYEKLQQQKPRIQTCLSSSTSGQRFFVLAQDWPSNVHTQHNTTQHNTLFFEFFYISTFSLPALQVE